MFYIRNTLYWIDELNPPESPIPSRIFRSSKRRDSYEKAVSMLRIESTQNVENEAIKGTAEPKENEMVNSTLTGLCMLVFQLNCVHNYLREKEQP